MLAIGCGPPAPPRGLDNLYARRPDLRGIDTTPLRGRVIVLDPGHGGRFAGSRGPEDTREADINLGVALYLWGMLHDAGADVHLTRSRDRDLLVAPDDSLRHDLAARVAWLDSLQPDVFLSLHHNSHASHDRLRNQVETYFKLEDPGPSFDLARAIHRRLAQHLGIDRADLRPGNYFVLRHAPGPAVLGEASYLSNPHVESRLRLAESQLLEAEAYFLGLLDYFATGVPRIARLGPPADTLRLGDRLGFRIEDDRGGGVDPLTVHLRLAGRRVDVPYDETTHTLELPIDAGVPPGRVTVTLEARNRAGNAAVPWADTLVVDAPAARLEVQQVPAAAPRGSRVRVRLRLFDALDRPLPGDVPITLRPLDAGLEAYEATTHDGEVLAWVALTGARPRLELVAGAFRETTALALDSTAPTPHWVQVTDARSAAPLQGAWIHAAGRPARTDRLGLAAVPNAGEPVGIRARGYLPWRGLPPAPPILGMTPREAAQLFGIRVALDPAADNGNGRLRPADAAWWNLRVVRRCAAWLAECGARPRLTRRANERPSLPERVRRADAFGAAWFVQVDAIEDSIARVLHHPGSARGQALAQACAYWMQRRGVADSVAVGAAERPVLRQTSSPAVVVQVPWNHRARPLAHLAEELAYALFLAVRTAVAPETLELPALSGEIALDVFPDASVTRFDALIETPVDAAGRFRFEAVTEGMHSIEILDRRGEPIHALEVDLGGVSRHLRLPREMP